MGLRQSVEYVLGGKSQVYTKFWSGSVEKKGQDYEKEGVINIPYTNCFSDVFAPMPTAYVRRSRLFQPT